VNWKRWIIGRNPKLFLVRLVILSVFAYLFFSSILIPVRYQADAMAPSIEKGSFIWVSKLPYWTKKPERGDVIAIQLAGSSVVRIARVIALAGEQVSLKSGEIYINGKPAGLEAFNLPHEMIETGYQSQEVELGEVFVLGDNRTMSLLELHSQGAMGRISKSRVIGKVLF